MFTDYKFLYESVIHIASLHPLAMEEQDTSVLLPPSSLDLIFHSVHFLCQLFFLILLS